MGKKKYQFGDDVNKPQAQMQQFSGQLPNKNILNFLLSQQGQNVVNQYKNSGYDINANDRNVVATRNTGEYKLPPEVQAFNALAQLTTGIANKASDIKNGRNEYQQYLQSLQPVGYENFNEQGLNNLPIYTQYGGDKCQDGCGSVDENYMQQMMKAGGWIQGAIKHPGRCAHPGDANCPKGSPQYNLAMRFKHGDLHKQMGGYSSYPSKVPTYDTQAAVDSANAQVRDFSNRHSLMIGADARVANKVGDPVVGYTNPNGTPYVPTDNSNASFVTKYVPQGINDLQWDNQMNLPYFVDPQSGDNKYVPQSYLNLPRFKKPKVIDNSVAKYPYGGGPLTADGAKEILKDGTVHGKKLTPAQRKYFGFVAGGGSPKSQYGSGGVPTIEAEKGESYQTPQGDIMQIPNSAPTHEQGGVIIPDAERVLENTSSLRKDKKSQALLLNPQLASMLTGFPITKPVSHAEAMDKAQDGIDNKVGSIQSKLKKNVKTIECAPKDKYALNSLDFNMLNLKSQPNPQDVFNSLFQHQEQVKDANGIENPKAKGQVGLDNAPRLHNTEGWDFLYTQGNKNYYKKQDGTVVSTDGPKMSNANWSTFLQNETPAHKADRLSKQNGNIQHGYTQPIADLDIQYPTATMPDVNVTSKDNGFSIPDNTTNNTLQQSRFNFTGSQPKSQFNEPLHWYDVAGPIAGLTEGRIPAKYNGADLNQIRLKMQNPLPSLQAGQRDYNQALDFLPENAQGYANAANIFGKKYSIDNQVLGQYENENNQIKNQETMYNAGVRDRQSLVNQQARGVFEDQRLGSLEAERLQHRTDWDSIMQTLAQNRALNRNGNLAMQLFPAFDQNAQYNGYQVPFRPPLSMPNTNNGLPQNTQIVTNNTGTGKQQFFIKTADGKLKPITFK